jgi:DNA polymerase-3 subunit delta
MLTYFEKPMASTVLIIGSKVDKLDERKSSTKLIKKTCLMFNSEKVKDWKLAEWVRDYTRELGFEINPDATQLLCDHVGNNLSAIVNELKKIIINCGDKRKIGIKEITTYVGISNEYNAFEMLKSIAKKDKTRTFQIAEVLSAQPLILVFSAMFNYFSTVYVCHLHGVNNPYDAAKITGRPPNIAEEYLACMRLYNPTKTERILQIINQYDLKEKGVNNVNTSSKSLLFELIAKIFSL